MSSESKTATEKDQSVGWVSPQGVTQRSAYQAGASEEFESVGLRPKEVPVGREASPTYGAAWPMVRLGDHVEACLGKMLDAQKNKGIPQPYLGNSNVRWGQFDLHDLAEMRFEPHEEERYSLLPGDLVVCEGGEPGRSAIWAGPPGMKVQKALHRIRPKAALDNYYLFYWFQYAAKAGFLEPYFTGTTIKHLTGRAISALEIPLPPIRIQRAMVDVLKSLDDRITLLRETNATLEAIAQALFKSWFVDFDPVHANIKAAAEGRAAPAAAHPIAVSGAAPDTAQNHPHTNTTATTNNSHLATTPAALDPATAALFPNSFQDSELGLIPEGWKLVPFGELLAHTIGGDWGDEHPNATNDTRVAIIRGTDIPDLQQGGANRVPIRFTSTKKLSTRMLRDGDLVIEVSGGSKDQPTGRALYLTEMMLAKFDCPVEPASFCRLLRPIDKNIGVLLAQHLIYIYSIGKTWEYQNQSTGIANFQTTHFLENELVAVPSTEVLTAFTNIVRPIIERSHLYQVQALTQLRDTLLPRLISGQLRLPDAQEKIEAALA